MTIGDNALHVCAVVFTDGVLFAAGQVWVTDGKTRSEYFLRITPGSGHCQERVSRFGEPLVSLITAFWVQAIPADLCPQQCHEISQNRLAFVGEQSVSVGHRRQPLPD